MSTPKLYRVTVEVTGWVMVLASSKHEAEQFAANDYDVERCELSRHEADVLATAEEAREVDEEDAESLPYLAPSVAGAEELTCGEWLERTRR